MKKFLLSVTCILTFNATQIYATIVHSYAITDIYHYIDPKLKPEDVLIVFDIDNTIAETADQLGTTQWFTAMHKLKEQQCGMTKMEAVKATVPILTAVVEQCPLQPIENTTVPLIKDLQNKQYKVISLTVRSPEELKTCTITHLNNIDIDFRRTSICSQNIIFDNNIQYIDGILFVDGGNKGEWLLHILKHVGYMPKLIIFIDDKEYNHLTVEGTLMQNGIDHTCIWYRYCDPKANTFDLSLTEKPLRILCEQYPTVQEAYQEWLYSFTTCNNKITEEHHDRKLLHHRHS